MNDLISRRVAIDELWKALYEYEDKTEKQFLESEDLDFGDWITHRIFVQHMNDIDRQTILNLPSAQPEQQTEVEDILQYLDEYLHPIVSPEHWEVYSELYDMISCLPSAQSERKNGKWHQRFYSQIEMMVCSECNSEFSYDAETGVRDYNFCPNCGADMRGEHDDSISD